MAAIRDGVTFRKWGGGKPLWGGTAAALGLLALYIGILSWAESWPHAWAQFRADAPLVLPILLSFGAQIGLFIHLKRSWLLPNGARGAPAMAGTSGSTSSAAMVACCAHHLTDVLPFFGLSIAATFLAEYRLWFMVAGLLSNIAGLSYLLLKLRQARRQALGLHHRAAYRL